MPVKKGCKNLARFGFMLALPSTMDCYGGDYPGPSDSQDPPLSASCIVESRISNVSFEDDQRALISLSGSDRVLMTLRSHCQGIRLNGYVHRSNNNTLCRGDVLRVLESGGVCIIESLEPYAVSRDPAP